jgi:hypothetical protein
MTMATKSRILSSIQSVLIGGLLGLAVLLAPPAGARTPLRSAEQLAQDEVLFAQASRDIAPQAMRCFKPPQNRNAKPFKMRFFLSDIGRTPSQFAVIGAKAVARPARSARERAAIRAIKTCAPYIVPEELRNWGGFWVTITF